MFDTGAMASNARPPGTDAEPPGAAVAEPPGVAAASAMPTAPAAPRPSSARRVSAAEAMSRKWGFADVLHSGPRQAFAHLKWQVTAERLPRTWSAIGSIWMSVIVTDRSSRWWSGFHLHSARGIRRDT